MMKRSWADYEEDEDFPPIPVEWLQSSSLKLTNCDMSTTSIKNNPFVVLVDEEDDEEELDFCIGCETGTDYYNHTCELGCC